MKFNLRKPAFDPLMTVDRIVSYVFPHFLFGLAIPRLISCYTIIIIHLPESVDMKLDMNIKAMKNQRKNRKEIKKE